MIYTDLKVSKVFIPMSVNINGKKFLIIGGGNIAVKKAKKLLEYGADITIISPEILECIENTKYIKAKYTKENLNDFDYVIAATDLINEEVRLDCNDLSIPCLDISCGEKSDFHLPAVIKRDSLLITVSSGGKSPGISKLIKKDINDLIDEEYINKANELIKFRKLIKSTIDDNKKREYLLRELIDLSYDELKIRRQNYEDKNRI